MEPDPVPPSSPPHATATLLSSPFLAPCYRGLSPTSSEPPLFSSDDPPEAADIGNYESPRIFKRKRAGPWWETEASTARPEVKKAKISRNFDSGVWMMSDATDSSEDALPDPHHAPFAVDETWDERIQRETKHMSQIEANFYRDIQEGVETNSQRHTFSDFGLQDDDIRHIRSLKQIIKAPPDPGKDVPAEGQYRSMLPELYVNLASNRLMRLNPALFEVQHLTSLVLRNNNIAELPSEITQLCNLKELDLSLNQLRYLPFEILSMLKPRGVLKRVQLVGNPLPQRMTSDRFSIHLAMDKLPPYTPELYNLRDRPQDHALNSLIKDLYRTIEETEYTDASIWRIRFLESWLPHHVQKHLSHHDHLVLEWEKRDWGEPVFIGRTPPAYFDQTGAVLKLSPKMPSLNDEVYDVIIQTNNGVYGTPSTWFTPSTPKAKVSSLLTLSLTSAIKHVSFEDSDVKQIWEMLEPDVPPEAGPILRRAEENNGAGYGYFRQCHVCSKDYVVPRAEWMEFWATGLSDIYPVMVRVCSWGCVPEDVSRRPETELDY